MKLALLFIMYAGIGYIAFKDKQARLVFLLFLAFTVSSYFTFELGYRVGRIDQINGVYAADNLPWPLGKGK